MGAKSKCFLLMACCVLTAAAVNEDRAYHGARLSSSEARNEAEKDAHYWVQEAQEAIEQLETPHCRRHTSAFAKNVVMFLGDGMSVPTLAAARTLLGQRQGKNGEETKLSFEKFPTVGLVKVSCTDTFFI